MLEKINCLRCNCIFQKKSFTHKYCGNFRKKIGCSYIMFRQKMQEKRIKNGYSEKPKYKILEILGRRCNKCKMTSNIKGFFDIDHIIPVKRKNLTTNTYIKASEFKRIDLKKIFQILCPNCHRLKTIQDRIKFSFGKKLEG